MFEEYWVWLQQVLGYGSSQITHILEEYGDAKSFYDAPDEEKAKRCFLTKKQFKKLHSVSRRTVYSIIKDCKKNNINIITPDSEVYPELLKNICDPPTVLYHKGNFFDFNKTVCITIVGPRYPTEYGKKLAHIVSGTLSECGCTVVSGGAIGIDKASHIGALDKGNPTVAVLGCGILNGYLKENKDLRQQISENGCLLSEYPPRASASKGSFPVRNRILSGLSLGTVVVEAPKISGALITARHANEQGRDVFAVPGRPTDINYVGTNLLIQDGAKPLLSVNDILNEYIGIYDNIVLCKNKQINVTENIDNTPKNIKNNTEKLQENTANVSISEKAVSIFNVINNDTFTTDDIVDLTGLEVSTVITALLELEINGFIKSAAGGFYERTHNGGN